MTTTAMFVILAAGLLANLLLTLRLARRLRNAEEVTVVPPEMPGLPLGQPAAAFVTETFDGERFAIEDYADRSLAVMYLSHQCTMCRTHMPSLADMYALAQRAGTELVAAIYDDTSQTYEMTAEAIEKYKIPNRVIIVRGDHPLQEIYNPQQASPYFYEIDRGIVRARGGVGGDDWGAMVDRWISAAEAQRSELAELA